MNDYDWPLQQAVYSAITGASISGLVDVVDYKKIDPGTSEFPYVQLGDTDALADDVSCRDGKEVYIDLHSWSRERGKKEIKQIMSALHGALHPTGAFGFRSGVLSCVRDVRAHPRRS